MFIRSIVAHYDIIAGVDYVSGPYTVTFPAGVTKVSFNVDIIDDAILENNETFELSINSNTLLDRVIINNPSKVTVTIVDNDGKLIINMMIYVILFTNFAISYKH